MLVVLETLREQIALADGELRVLADEDARMLRIDCRGIGPVTATRFVAELQGRQIRTPFAQT